MNNIDFDALKISLASPEKITEWSYGEVTKAETINYRTLKPEKDGLFDERIFGPTKDLECYCGKYKRLRYKGVVCEKCGVEVTYSRVRRERMGHIELAAPTVHTWYFKRTPSKLPAILNIGQRDLESIIYFAQYLVTEIDEDKRAEVLQQLEEELQAKLEQLKDETDVKAKELEKAQDEKLAEFKKEDENNEAVEMQIANLQKQTKREILYLRERLIRDQNKVEDSSKRVSERINSIQRFSVISETEMQQFAFWGVDTFFKAGKGAEIVEEALRMIDLDEEIEDLKKDIQGKSKARRQKAIKRLKIIQGIKSAKIDPAWTILKQLPVIPPELRPMVQLPGGRFATSDLNDLYRRVINRNNRLKSLIQLSAPDIILQNEKRMLQEAIDSLFESSKKLVRGRRELQSLSDMLKGKQGRFRQNLLGKRVDYSGRSVIVVGPNLRIDQVGVPKEMALELFKPFVLRDLILDGYAPNLKSAKYVLEARGPEVWDILERITKDHPILLNRAPTLHRQNIQAFYPVLVDGKAITFHPAVVGSFAGDFDGDQMAIHIPLSKKAIEEARERLLTPHNLLKLSTGKPIIDLKQEISLGVYYLTLMEETEKEGIAFANIDQVMSAYQNKAITIHTPVRIKVGEEPVQTTPGRILFNQILPEKLVFVNETVNRDVMRRLIAECFDEYGEERTTEMIDAFKEYGQTYTTKAGISYSMFDFSIPEARNEVIAEAHKKIDGIEENYQLGLMTRQERHNQIIGIWEDVTSDVSGFVMDKVEDNSVIGMMLNSKAFKTNPETIRQVEGMKGLMVDSQGFIKETPITSSILEGFTSFEMFLNMIGGRKSLIDVALLTAEAGYLTRRLVDVAHDVLVRSEDCGTKEGIFVREESGVDDWALKDRIEGRTAWKDVKDSKGNVLVKAGEVVSVEQAQAVQDANVEEVGIYNVLTCDTPFGVCTKCYGKDMATREPVAQGEAVGVIAAQSIGEPGTQLTLHSKHRAGVAKKEITQGLPRIEELFEARNPKHTATLTNISGTVSQIDEKDDELIIVVESDEKTKDGEKITERYSLPLAADLKVKVKDVIHAGDVLTEGQPQLDEVLEIKGALALQKYLLKEIQTVYKGQGVNINDKHVEVIVRKMTEKVRIQSPSTSTFLPGDFVNVHEFKDENARLKEAGEAPLKGTRTIMGISKAALHTESWLSAASFEETANVLAAAAINERPQTDHLLGLKENVIIGRLIPTGERAELNTSEEDIDVVEVATADTIEDEPLTAETVYVPEEGKDSNDADEDSEE